MPPPRASVPVWAHLHRATMHVAGAVASRWWDRPAQKRSLLRQHMAIEECVLQGGRSSTCVARQPGRAAPPKTADVPQSGHWLFFSPLSHTNEQTGLETLGQKKKNNHNWALREGWSPPRDEDHLLNWFTCCSLETGTKISSWNEA